MKKESIWIAMVAFLIVLNVAILFLFLGGKNPGRPGQAGPPPRDRQIIEVLSLDKGQQAKFEVLKDEHRAKMRELNLEANDLLQSYFMLLESGEIDSAQKDSLESEFAALEKEKMNVTFDHFQKLKTLCSPDQQKEFDAFIPTLIELVLPRGQEKLPPPRRN